MLVLPTDGYRASAFLTAASRLDLDVIVAINEAPPMASEMEDRLVVVDFDTPEASASKIAALAARHNFDAVVGVDDQGVLTAAHACELLGLPHSPPDAVAATRDKADMRSIFSAWNIPQPRFQVVAHGASVAEAASEVGLPCVVKPVSLSASTGVIRADSPADAQNTEFRIRRILLEHGRPGGEPLMVEEFIGGPEVSVEALMVDGNLEVLAIFDKPDPLDGPYFEETIYVTPSRLSDAQKAAVIDTTRSGCRALGLSAGPVHAELRVGPERPDGTVAVKVIEVAARSIGGLCSRVLQFGSDISLEELIIRSALGTGTGGMPLTEGASGVMMIPIPRSGVLTGVDGTEDARHIPGVTGLEISAAIGRPIKALPEGGRYLGFIFARGETAELVEAALRSAHDALTISIGDPDAGSTETQQPDTASTETQRPDTPSTEIDSPVVEPRP